MSNNSAGNENATAEAQIISEYFKLIEVDNPLTKHIYEKLISERCNVILTGNAGDGKTTIAMDIFMELSGERRQLNAREVLPDWDLIIIKDMSEIDEKTKILNEAADSENTYLIISNTGTLINSFSKLESNDLGNNGSELLRALESTEPCKILNGRFLMFNIGRMDSIKTACAVFKRMLENDNWSVCLDCNISNLCPIRANVVFLQERFNIVSKRLCCYTGDYLNTIMFNHAPDDWSPGLCHYRRFRLSDIRVCQNP